LYKENWKFPSRYFNSIPRTPYFQNIFFPSVALLLSNIFTSSKSNKVLSQSSWDRNGENYSHFLKLEKWSKVNDSSKVTQGRRDEPRSTSRSLTPCPFFSSTPH
jgi:hypothetical protein